MRARAWILAVTGLLTAGAARAGDLEIEDVVFKAGKLKIERANRSFKANELIWIGFTVTGFGHDEIIHLEESLRVLAPDGSVAYEKVSASRFRVEWDEELTEALIQNNVQLTGSTPKGEYTAEITIEDKIEDRTKVFKEKFYIGGKGKGGTKVSSRQGGNLTVRDPLLVNGPKGGPRDHNVYHPGDKVFLRFEVGGAAVSDQQMIWLQQDLELLGPDGQRVFMRKNISGIKQKVSVEIDWVTLNNAAKLQQGLETGTYKLVIHLRDKIAAAGTMAWREIYVRPR